MSQQKSWLRIQDLINLFFSLFSQIGSLSWSILPGKVLFRDVLYMTPDFRSVMLLLDLELDSGSHCPFLSNLFHGQIAQIYINHLSGYENEKCSPWNKTPCYFWAGEALEARTRGCLNVTSAQKWHSVIFQISAEKVSWHHIIIFLHLLNESRGFAT